MDAEPINIHQAKTHFSRLVERVISGERIVIARNGQPVADLVPHAGPSVTLGALDGHYSVDDSAFTRPDPDIQSMFYGDDDPSRHA